MTVSQQVRSMIASGLGRGDIVAALGATSSVLMAYKRAIERPVVRPWGRNGTTSNRAISEASAEEKRQEKWRIAQARAGILHLVDLKRAGYSPRFTELNIPPEGVVRRVSRPLAQISFTGSSSATAAGL